MNNNDIKNKEITVSAPGKLMLFGEHAVVYGRPCIVTAVDQRLSLTAVLTDDNVLSISAPEVEITDYKKDISEIGKGDVPKGVTFLEQTLVNFRDEYGISGGISITTSSEFSSTFGFGSSAASAVCMAKALSLLFEKNLSEHELFGLAYKTVLDIQGKGSGFDIAAAVWGGTLYFETGGKVVRPLSITHLPLVVGYTGTKADTTTLVNHVAQLKATKSEEIEIAFDEIEQIVKRAEPLLEKGELMGLGELMKKNQELLEKLDVSSEILRNLITAAEKNGAYGAKLSGAGGGDCMIAICEKDNQEHVEQAITEVGGKILKVGISAEGVREEGSSE